MIVQYNRWTEEKIFDFVLCFCCVGLLEYKCGMEEFVECFNG